MAEIDPLTLKIIADTKDALQDVAKFQRVTGQGLNRVERDVLKLEAQMKRSSGAIGASLKGIAGTLGTLFTGRELVGLIDSFTRLQNSLRVAGLEGTQLEQVQGRLLALSSKYGVGVEGLANLYGKSAQAASELGASQGQLLQLTEASAQALKITGTSAVQAQGALLGLTQALASGTVRAEEFNQINEGGLRPLLQAAANAERFGGSVAKLRQAVIDGKFSSQEFYQSILAGSAELDAKASKATLTLAGAYEALTSNLTVYVGQSAQANGATAALAGAMKLLADNIDTIIPALATIAAFTGTRMVIAAIAASRAYAAFSAVLIGTTTASATASAGIAALTAALTGPTGIALAITAVVGGLYYLSTQAEGTADSIKALQDSNQNASDELDRMIGRLKAAGVQTDELAAAAARAKAPIDDLADAYRNALIEARRFSAGTTGGKIQQQSDIISGSQASQAGLRQSIAAAQRAKALAGGGNASAAANLDTRISGLKAQLAAEIQKERIARATIGAFAAANQANVDVADGSVSKPSTGTAPKPKAARTPRARAGTDPLDAQFRNDQELRSLQIEELRAREQTATSADEKARFAREGLDLERQARLADINEAVRKKQYGEEEAKKRREIIENLYGSAAVEGEILVQGKEAAYQRAITREEQERIARQQTDAMRDELDALGAEAGVTDVRKARVEIERRMLEIQQQIERDLLDEAIARGDVLDAAQARAALSRKQAAERTGFTRDNQGPLGQYVQDLQKAGLNLDDQFESVAVNGLRSLNDGLADAIANSKNLGDVFSNVAKQIIADLIRIAIQQTIVNALASAFNLGGNGGGGGGIFGSILGAAGSIFGGSSGSIVAGESSKIDNIIYGSKNPFGRASGGPVNAGSLYRINESASPGNPEYFQPANSGTVIPLGQVNQRVAQPGAQGGGVVKIVVEEGPNFMSTIRTEAVGVAVEVTRAAAPSIIDASANETSRRMSRPRMPGAGR